MKTSDLDRATKFLRVALLAGGILFVVLYIGVALLRIRYPFELEWLEGGMVDHVLRILSGQQLYANPTMEFTPFLYTPLYYYISAAVAQIVGIGFFPLRLVSFAASLGCFVVIYGFVRRETGNLYSAILAMGMFAATYRIGGAWMDIARGDTLFVFLALLAIYLVRFYDSWSSYVLAGILISLSFLTKQAALTIAVPMALYCLITNWRRSSFFIGTATLIIAGSTLLLDRIHDGWYSFYVFDLPVEHYSLKARYVFFWVDDLLAPLPAVCVVSVVYLLSLFSQAGKKRALFYVLMTAGMIGTAWSGRLHSGGYLNALMPGFAFLAILFGLGFHGLADYFHGKGSASNGGVTVALTFFYLVCAAQFGGLLYNPKEQIPTRRDLDAGWSFIQMLKGIDGEVYMPGHGFLPGYAGKKSYAHAAAVADVLRSKETSEKAELLAEITNSIRQQYFSAIILDKDEYVIPIQDYYSMVGRVFSDYWVFWTVTGVESRPEFLFVPKEGSALKE